MTRKFYLFVHRGKNLTRSFFSFLDYLSREKSPAWATLFLSRSVKGGGVTNREERQIMKLHDRPLSRFRKRNSSDHKYFPANPNFPATAQSPGLGAEFSRPFVRFINFVPSCQAKIERCFVLADTRRFFVRKMSRFRQAFLESPRSISEPILGFAR